jgi:hypothetical protein
VKPIREVNAFDGDGNIATMLGSIRKIMVAAGVMEIAVVKASSKQTKLAVASNSAQNNQTVMGTQIGPSTRLPNLYTTEWTRR